jgi:putative ABC transport system permease protein
MPRPPRFIRRLISLFAWGDRDREMDREMSFHIDSLAHEYVRDGMSDADARRAARARFGDTRRLKERGHDVRIGHRLEDLTRDLRHTARGLRKNPGFTTAVVLTLALGIGGNVAIFSLIDQLLLRPLPYPDGEKVVAVYESFLRGFGGAPATTRSGGNSVSPANWFDWQRESRQLEGFAAWRQTPQTLTGVGDPVRLSMQFVSHEFFPLLGVGPLLGRTVSAEDDRPNAPRVAVLSHQLWQGRFGGDPSVIGRVIQLSDNPVEVVGVMPPGFRFLDPRVELWSALQLDRGQAWRSTAGRFLNVVGRLTPGATMGSAQTEMGGIAERLAKTYEFNKNTSVVLVPLREELTGQVQSSLMVLYVAVGVLLSIVCFNVASLLLARGAARRHEIAIRTSLGAGRIAIVRQLMVESLLLAGLGGVLGIVVASASLDALVAFAPPNLLRVPDLSIDVRVMLYALGLSIVTGLIVGLAPAVLVARESLVSSIRSGGLNVTHAPRVRQVLVVCQVAMTVMLLCGAGLLVRTVLAMNRAETGLDRQNVVTMEVILPAARYDAERRVQFFRQAIDEIAALPSVESAAAGNSLAVIGSPRGGTVFHRQGTPEVPINDRPVAVIRVVTPGFFRTLRIPVLRGREFVAADAASPTPGFVVNDAFVRAYLAGVDPLSARLSVLMQQENPYAPIIGVVGNVNEGSVRDDARPTVYYSHGQMRETGMTIFARASAPMTVAAAAVDVIQRMDRNLPVARVRTFDNAFSESLARERLNALVSGAFAASGLLLASLGLYGLLAFLVTERTKEIGIRIALGAESGRLTRSVIGGGLRLVAIGAGVGVVGALLLLRSLQTLLFGVTSHDLSTYAFVLLLLCVVSVLASYIPARAAARVEPLKALRQE